MSIEAKPAESRESSSPVVTKAVAAGLMGQSCEVYSFSNLERLGLKAVGALPQAVGRWLIPRIQPQTAYSAEAVGRISIEDLVAERVRDYDKLDGKFPAVLMGVAQGGTTAHLALDLGAPFLPQAFVLTLKDGSYDGRVEPYFQRSADLALQFARRQPNVMTIQHYDPIHDGWLTRFVNHLRIKLIDLPEAYRHFLRERLEPGGAVVYLDGGASWLRYRVGERSVFQVGGWGDISPEEFLQSSERIQAYCKKIGMESSSWKLPGYPLEWGPESEWGSEAGLGDALEHFCHEEGFEFVRISMADPNDFNRLAFAASWECLRREGKEPAGVAVEMFSQFDATAVRRGNLLPLWLIFNTTDSVRFLKQMAPSFPKGEPIFFSPLATFSLTPDLAAWEDWESALSGLDVRWMGSRKSHYPADARALLDWAAPLHEWVAQQNAAPVTARLSGRDLLRLAEKIQKE
jgi:hypothetical protein